MANIGFSSPERPRTAPTASQKQSEEQPWWKFQDVSSGRLQTSRGPKNIHEETEESDWWFGQPTHWHGTPGENGRDISAVDSKGTIEGPKQCATAGSPCKEDAEFGKYFRRNSMQNTNNVNNYHR